MFIVNNDLCDLTNMRTMNSIYSNMGNKNYLTILNNSNRKKNYFTKYDVRHMLNGCVDYIIPSNFNLKNIEKYTLDGKILTLNKKLSIKNKKTINIYKKIINRILV